MKTLEKDTMKEKHAGPSKCVCLKCGYDWNSLKGKPKVCPRCKSYSWDKQPIRIIKK